MENQNEGVGAQKSNQSLASVGFANDSSDESYQNGIKFNLTIGSTSSSPDPRPFRESDELISTCFFEPANDSIPNDVICLILICPKHRSIALQKIKMLCDKHYYFFPTFKLLQGIHRHQLTKTIVLFIEIIIGRRFDHTNYLVQANLLNVYRVFIPRIQRFITRMIFQVLFEPCDSSINLSDICICLHHESITAKKTDPVQWFVMTDIEMILTNVWGSELMEFLEGSQTFQQPNLLEIDQQVIEQVLSSHKNGLDDAQLRKLKLASIDLFNEFMMQSFPSCTMSMDSFYHLCDKLSWFLGDSYMYHRNMAFKSFDIKDGGFLSYSDLLHGLLSLGPVKSDDHQILFGRIMLKFHCRNFAQTDIQKLIEANLYFGRCESCLYDEIDLKIKSYSISSNIVKLTEFGEIRRLFRLKTNPEMCKSMAVVAEIPEMNIFNLANEFMKRIEKIYKFRHETPPINQFQLENFFFENNTLMLHYLELLLQFSKRLLENHLPIIDIHSPCYIIGYIDGCLEDLLSYSDKIFKRFPFISSENLVFLGNYTENLLNQQQDLCHENLECLIYVLCMKILAPQIVFLLRGRREVECFTYDSMQKTKKKDRITRLIMDIYELLPIACTIDEQIFVSNFQSIPDQIPSYYKLKIIGNWISSSIPLNNIDRQYYKCEMFQNYKRQPLNRTYGIHNRNWIPFYQDFLEDIFTHFKDNPQCDKQKLQKFLLLNRFFILVDTNNQASAPINEENERDGLEFPLNDFLDWARLLSTRKITQNPTCLFLDRNVVRFICME